MRAAAKRECDTGTTTQYQAAACNWHDELQVPHLHQHGYQLIQQGWQAGFLSS